jgi:hypothetical protein
VGWLWDGRESSPVLVRAANVAQTMASRDLAPSQHASERLVIASEALVIVTVALVIGTITM